MTAKLVHLVSALWLAAAVGCGGLPPVPSHGGPRWLALQSAHVTLYTDQSEREARAASARLERTWSALRASLGEPDARLQLDVIMLADRTRLAQFTGAGDDEGVFVPQLLFGPVLVTAARRESEPARVLNHHLVHMLVSQAIAAPPPWLVEGLATYFESAHFEPGGSFVVGAAPPEYLHARERIPAATLLNMEEPGELRRFDASAWLLMHYLMSERRGELAAFRAELASGASPAQSWKETLPDLSPERVDALLVAYAKRTSFLTLSREVEAPASEPRVRALSDADVYTVRAELYSSCAGCSADSEKKTLENLRAALQAEPGHVRASVLLAQRTAANGAGALAAARALQRRHPEAWLAWLNLARVQSDPRAAGCDADVVPELAALAPEQPYAVMASALCELRAGHAQRALELSQRALSLAPASVELATLRAGVLRALGRCTELASMLTRVRSAAHTRVAPDQVEALAVCSEAPVARE
jgi:hypothetical protein